MPSIQSSITKFILGGIFLVAAATGIIIEAFIQQQFNTQFNKTLENKAWALATLNDQENGQVEFEFADEMMPEFEARQDAEYFELWLANGEMLERSHSLKDSHLPFIDVDTGKSIFQDVELPDGRPGRMITIHFIPRVDKEEEETATDQHIKMNATPLQSVTLALARGRTELIQNHLLNRTVIILSLLSMILVSYLIIQHSIRKGLLPLKNLSEQVQSIDDHTLDTELDTHNMHSELSSITLQLNHLLSRLNEAFKREKRFTSNVAHELRTPIAELMALSDVAKSCIDNPEMARQFFDDTQDIAHNMNLTVETLLTLAQTETSNVQTNMSVFNLHECIQTSLKKVKYNATNSPQVHWEGLSENFIQVYSDWDKLSQILNNLISNAYKYCLPGGAINIQSTLQGRLLSLSISNQTSGLEKEDLEHLTEYFWRKDDARSGGKNTGLGLTLVAILCKILNISLSFELSDEKLFTVTLDNLSAWRYNS